MKRFMTIVLLALSVAGLDASRAASREAVDLELALAIDVSGSIDPVEARLQRDGYIAAFRHPDVIRAIRGGILGRIAVAYYEWAGFGHNKIIVEWTLVRDTGTAHGFAARLTEDAPQTARRTAIGSALSFAAPYFERNIFDGTRKVIDISGDGPNNWGLGATAGRDMALAAGITINGLPIINQRASLFGWPSMPNLDLYYRDCVIGGPGAFLVIARSFEDFAIAIRRKLILEIAGLAPPEWPPAGSIHRVAGRGIAGRAAPPCDFGERRWRDRDDF